MNIQTQATIWFIPIIISVLVTLFYILTAIKGRKNIKALFLQISVINLVLFLLGAFFWFGVAVDGFSQINGVALYALIFVVIEGIISIVLYFASKHRKTV